MLGSEIDILDAFFNSKPDIKVFEWGSGGSTVRWGCMVKKWIAVEHDPKWANDVVNEMIKNDFDKYKNTFVFHIELDDPNYCELVTKYLDFDLFIIDGRKRKECFKTVVATFKKPCIIIEHDCIRTEPNDDVLNKTINTYFEVHNGLEKGIHKGLRFYNLFCRRD
jgi:hypothetical protein